MSREIAESERTRANLIQVGTVQALDLPKARARVLLAGVNSAWLPWLATRAGGDRTWNPPTVGEQVLVAILQLDQDFMAFAGVVRILGAGLGGFTIQALQAV